MRTNCPRLRCCWLAAWLRRMWIAGASECGGNCFCRQIGRREGEGNESGGRGSGGGESEAVFIGYVGGAAGTGAGSAGASGRVQARSVVAKAILPVRF